MKATAPEVEEKVDGLLDALDKDVEHIQQSLSRLNELRSLAIKRDEAALCKLLEGIQADSQDYRSHELNRQEIRKELAVAVGCSFEQMTLSRLENQLPAEKWARVRRRKEQLSTLTSKLRMEHLSTTMLLQELARFNRLLLNSILDFGKSGTVTYDSNGATSRDTDTAFVNLHF